MSAHLTWEELNDYADGVLATDDRDDAGRHLDRCAACRDQLAEIRALLDEAAIAVDEIDPPAEAWPALRTELERRKVVVMARSNGARSTWRTIPSRTRWTLAAAALVLITVSSAITTMLVRERANVIPGVGSSVPAPSIAASTLEVAQVERGYLDSVVELTEALEAARPRLAKETIAIVERNLAVIDAAIVESRAALLRDPGNRVLLDVLAGTYRQKLDLLRRAAQLASS
jgi:anti-sigma factor RsiW